MVVHRLKNCWFDTLHCYLYFLNGWPCKFVHELCIAEIWRQSICRWQSIHINTAGSGNCDL